MCLTRDGVTHAEEEECKAETTSDCILHLNMGLIVFCLDFPDRNQHDRQENPDKLQI